MSANPGPTHAISMRRVESKTHAWAVVRDRALPAHSSVSVARADAARHRPISIVASVFRPARPAADLYVCHFNVDGCMVSGGLRCLLRRGHASETHNRSTRRTRGWARAHRGTPLPAGAIDAARNIFWGSDRTGVLRLHGITPASVAALVTTAEKTPNDRTTCT